MTCDHCNLPITADSTLLLKANYRAINYKAKFPHINQHVLVADNIYHKGCW